MVGLTEPQGKKQPPGPIEGLLRFVSIGLRRYSREPDSRANSARLMMSAAIRLFAEETTAGEAALTASEIFAELSAEQRKADREATP